MKQLTPWLPEMQYQRVRRQTTYYDKYL